MKGAKHDGQPSGLRMPAIGLESEFTLVLDGRPVKPEDVFEDPRAFIRGPLVHRTGTSYQLPTGGIIYFDTGVIEVATPLIELERGCVARAGRSLWESICLVRSELDGWEARTGHSARLMGFSTHYNVSIDPSSRAGAPSIDALGRLLTYILAPPVMVLALNRQSTGVGVRPRGDRIEVTADFTPSSTLMVAAGSLITGVVREVAGWRSIGPAALSRRGVPTIRGFRPMRHTSRRGWLARVDCFPQNPITNNVDATIWQLGRDSADRESLRDIALQIFGAFRRSIAHVADPLSLRLIHAVLTGRARSLLDLAERPREYEDVGRLCGWQPFYPESLLARSRFEQVVVQALSGQKLHVDGFDYTPAGMQGWSRVVFNRDSDGERLTLPLEDLLPYLPRWGAR